jgi:hypothetical protein
MELRLPTGISAAYYLFWRTYANRVDLRRLDELFGARAGTVTRAILPLLAAARLVERSGSDVWLTPRGRDVYHDIERWVTYNFIEPLWAEMMAEHGEARPADGDGHGHGGLLWALTRRMLRA